MIVASKHFNKHDHDFKNYGKLKNIYPTRAKEKTKTIRNLGL